MVENDAELRAGAGVATQMSVFDDLHHWLALTGLSEPPRYRSGPVEMIYGAGSTLIRRSEYGNGHTP